MPLPGDYINEGVTAPEHPLNTEEPAKLAELRRELAAEGKAPQTYRTFDEEEIHDIFTYHPPTHNQAATYGRINDAFIECALKIAPLMPDGPGKTAAMRKLNEARHAANATVALKGKF